MWAELYRCIPTFKRCSQTSQENTCIRDSANLEKFPRTSFWTTASGFSFSETATGVVLWKNMFLKISQSVQENTCGLQNFQEHHFYRTLLDDCFWTAAPCNFTKTEHCQQNLENFRWILSIQKLSNLRSTVQVSYRLKFRRLKVTKFLKNFVTSNRQNF